MHEAERMPTKASHLTTILSTFMQLSEREALCLMDLESSALNVKAGEELVHEGQTGHLAYILQAGWVCSFKLLPDGGRQIIAFPLPRDCVGLRSVRRTRPIIPFPP